MGSNVPGSLITARDHSCLDLSCYDEASWSKVLNARLGFLSESLDFYLYAVAFANSKSTQRAR